MQINIDTPYVTVGEYARRSGQSDTAIRKEIEQGHYLIRPKKSGSKSAVLINMVHIAIEAAEQAQRVLPHVVKKSGGR
ncbi:hypothetical protein [Pseudomonas paraveronii]|uniref:hypothetical protein n=1 Tax=Pseudomonas paraveronii TaxID=3040598 RepID=UPI002AB300D6|nr:hypothetical protein [Pseudomonas sp. V3/K/3/5]